MGKEADQRKPCAGTAARHSHPAHDEIVARKLRVAAYARVSSLQRGSAQLPTASRINIIPNSSPAIRIGKWSIFMPMKASPARRSKARRFSAHDAGLQERKDRPDLGQIHFPIRPKYKGLPCGGSRTERELGVSVQFEEQGIDTARVSSEMVTAIMASLAQKGSESISGNVQWGYQKRMESGKFNTCKAPYGFRLQNGQLVIEENEAVVVRQIFNMFLKGNSREEIASALRTANAPTRKDVEVWAGSTVYPIFCGTNDMRQCTS